MEHKVVIVESDMSFGEFDSNDVFHIEKSGFYKLFGKNVRCCEFLLRRDSKSILFVEAKSSSPKPENLDDYKKFIAEITEKFSHSFEIWMTAITHFRKCDINHLYDGSLSGVIISFVLVIKGHKEDWLAPIMEELKYSLRMYTKIWNVNIKVLNDDGAQKSKLIV